MSVETQDTIQRLFEIGIILPRNAMKARELWFYQTNERFWDNTLEKFRQMCPTLFKPGHNVINDPKYFHLNMEMYNKLVKHHPRISFQTQEDIERFCSSPTFYLIENRDNLNGSDLLENDYQECDLLFLLAFPGDFTHCQVYSQEELIGSFLSNYDFVDPYSGNNQKFTQAQIKRLLHILLKIHRVNIYAAIFVDVIDTVRAGTVRRMKYVDKIRKYAQKNPGITRLFLNEVLTLAMRMRGWPGGGDYPLVTEETVRRIDETALTEQLFNFSQKFASGRPGSKLCDLPLFTYRNRQFDLSTNEEVGLTIADKIEIVLHNTSVHACIRMSSNWLASSAWYYFHEFFDEIPFDIEKLGEIM